MMLVVWGLATVTPGPAPLATARAAVDLDPAEVRAAIERGVAYLKRQQRGNGTWPELPGYEGGITALCTLALLNAGVDPQDEAVQRSLAYLRRIEPSTTYTTSLVTMALCAAEPERDLPLIRRNVRWFEANQIKLGDRRGGWAYPRGGGDNSNAQFAILALHEAHLVGVSASDITWQLARDYWRRAQNNNGGWGYIVGGSSTGSMTCAGIGAMVIIDEKLSPGDARVEGGTVLCCARQETEPAVERGIQWLARAFSVHNNPAQREAWHLYYLYGLERVGRLTARRMIGQHDWYREGTDMFVRSQDRLSGFWKGSGQENDPHVATSFALLFLSKGRRPVLLAKLKHSVGEDWNNHRNDVANLTRHVERRWERDLSWQVVDAELATVDDLLQAPVVYISGRDTVQFDDRQVAALREYVNLGGFIFAEACCQGDAFDRSFRQLMQRVFPEPEYELRLLSPDHPVWFADEKIAPGDVVPLLGIDVGCRTSVIYSPQDLSCYWELAREVRGQTLPPEVRARVLAAQAIGTNVLAYATGRELKFKYEIAATSGERPSDDPVERAKLYIAKLEHTGGWNVAPRALVNLQEALGREAGVRVGTEQRELSIRDPRLFDYSVAFMHGRSSFQLSAAEREQLRRFVERGGTLLADSVCGSEAFTAAFRREMAAIFPEHPLQRVPATAPLWTSQYGGFELPRVTRREPERLAAGEPLRAALREVEPQLEAIDLGTGRYSVLFSPYDLSCALDRHESIECRGYTREDAARIAINVLLYALAE